MSDIASAEDFARAAGGVRSNRSEILTLPSGLRVRASQPEPLAWIRTVGRLPQGLAVAMLGGDSGAARASSPEEVVRFSQWVVDLVEQVVIEPRIRRNPGPGEVDPALISDPDLKYLIRYAGGEIPAQGRGLENFPGQSGGDSSRGESGRAVEQSTESVA